MQSISGCRMSVLDGLLTRRLKGVVKVAEEEVGTLRTMMKWWDVQREHGDGEDVVGVVVTYKDLEGVKSRMRCAG